MAVPTLRHRIQRNLEAEAEEVATDTVIESIVDAIPQTAEAA